MLFSETRGWGNENESGNGIHWKPKNESQRISVLTTEEEVVQVEDSPPSRLPPAFWTGRAPGCRRWPGTSSVVLQRWPSWREAPGRRPGGPAPCSASSPSSRTRRRSSPTSSAALRRMSGKRALGPEEVSESRSRPRLLAPPPPGHTHTRTHAHTHTHTHTPARAGNALAEPAYSFLSWASHKAGSFWGPLSPRIEQAHWAVWNTIRTHNHTTSCPHSSK